MKAKYDGIIHELVSHEKVWHNDNIGQAIVENCKTKCGLSFAEMGTKFHGNEKECEACKFKY